MTDDHTYGKVNAANAAKLLRPVETHVSKKETLSSKPVQVSLVNQLETLAAEIENINPLSSRIDALNELAWRWRYREKEQALQICLHTRQLSQTAEFEEHPYLIGLATGLATSSFIHQIRYDFDEAMTEAIQALTILEGFPLLPAASDARISIGWINLTIGDFSTALEYAMPALQIAREIHDLERQAYALDVLGNIYCKSSDYDHALENHHEALQLAEKIAVPEISMILFNNLANTLFEMKRFSEALPYSLKAIDLARNLGLLSEELILISTISEILVGMKSFEEAGVYLQDALTKYQNSNLAHPYVFMLIMFGLAGLNMDQEKYPIAEPFLFQALEPARQYDFKTTQMLCHQQLCTIYENTDQYHLALEHFKQFHALQVSISGKDMARKIALLKAEYRIELSRREAESFRTQNRELQHEIEERKLAEDALAQTAARLSLAVRAGGVGTWEYDILNDRLTWDDQMCRLYGITAQDFSGAYDAWRQGLHSLDRERGDNEIQAAQRGEKEYDTEFRVVRPDGSVHDIRALALVQRDKAGEPVSMLGTNWEITAQKLTEEALRYTHWKLESTIEGTQAGTWEWNVPTGEMTFNEIWAQPLGYSLSELAPTSIKTWEMLTHPDDLIRSGELLARHFMGELAHYDCELRMKHKDGHWVWVHERGQVITRMADGKPLLMFGTHTDISLRKAAEEKIRLLNIELEELALTDFLTNLFNRRYFMRQGAEAVKRVLRYKEPLSLLMLDIDWFKKVNDTYGHEVGDLALQHVAEVLKSSLREIDILARIGGEEFAVLLPNTGQEDAAVLAERVRRLIQDTPCETSGEAITITISLGAAVCEDGMKDIDDLLRRADAALYEAKRSGRNCVVIFQDNLPPAEWK